MINQLKPTPKKIIESPTGQAKFGLDRDEVEYCEATSRNYTNVYFVDGKVELFSRNLGLICTVLELERPHKSFGVNPNYVRFRNEGSVSMKSGKVIPVSRRREISPKQKKYEY